MRNFRRAAECYCVLWNVRSNDAPRADYRIFTYGNSRKQNAMASNPGSVFYVEKACMHGGIADGTFAFVVVVCIAQVTEWADHASFTDAEVTVGVEDSEAVNVAAFIDP